MGATSLLKVPEPLPKLFFSTQLPNETHRSSTPRRTCFADCWSNKVQLDGGKVKLVLGRVRLCTEIQ